MSALDLIDEKCLNCAKGLSVKCQSWAVILLGELVVLVLIIIIFHDNILLISSKSLIKKLSTRNTYSNLFDASLVESGNDIFILVRSLEHSLIPTLVFSFKTYVSYITGRVVPVLFISFEILPLFGFLQHIFYLVPFTIISFK